MTVSAWDPDGSRPPQKRKAHVVANVTFAYRSNDGALQCSCGTWMLASQFAAHRTPPPVAVVAVARLPSVARRQGTCIYGHALTPDNIFHTTDGRDRCLTCRHDASAHQWQREKAARATA